MRSFHSQERLLVSGGRIRDCGSVEFLDRTRWSGSDQQLKYRWTRTQIEKKVEFLWHISSGLRFLISE